MNCWTLSIVLHGVEVFQCGIAHLISVVLLKHDLCYIPSILDPPLLFNGVAWLSVSWVRGEV
jgi:hypothetical protein